MTILLKINPWTGREVALEEAEKVKQEELGTKDELFAVDLVGYDDNRRDDNVSWVVKTNQRTLVFGEVSLYGWSPVLHVCIPLVHYLHTKNNLFTLSVKSRLVKLETSRTVILRPTVSVLCDQSYKASTIVNYDPRVVPDWKIPHITTLES